MAETIGKVQEVNGEFQIIDENGNIIQLQEGLELQVGDQIQGTVQIVDGEVQIIDETGNLVQLTDGQTLETLDDPINSGNQENSNQSNNDAQNVENEATNQNNQTNDSQPGENTTEAQNTQVETNNDLGANNEENLNNNAQLNNQNTVIELNNGQEIVVNNQNNLLLDQTVTNNTPADFQDTVVDNDTLDSLENDLVSEENLVAQNDNDDNDNEEEEQVQSDDSKARELDRNAQIADVQADLREDVRDVRPESNETEDEQVIFIEAEISLSGVTSVIEGNTASYTLSLTLAPTSDVTVNLKYSGVALDGTDYTSVKTVTIPSGSLSVNFTIDTIDDYYAEGTEPYTLKIDSVEGGGFDQLNINPNSNSITTDIIDANSPGPDNETPESEDTVYVKVTGNDTTKEIDGETLTHRISLVDNNGNPVTVPSSSTIKVKVIYTNDTTESEDFTTKITEVEIPAGQTYVDIVNIVKDDEIYEFEEGYTLVIDEVTDVNNVFEKLDIDPTDNSVTGKIADEDRDTPDDKEADKPVVSITALDDKAVEGYQRA